MLEVLGISASASEGKDLAREDILCKQGFTIFKHEEWECELQIALAERPYASSCHMHTDKPVQALCVLMLA